MSLLGVLFSEMKVTAMKRAAESTSQSAPDEDEGGAIRCVCKNSQSCLVNVKKNEILNYVFAQKQLYYSSFHWQESGHKTKQLQIM